MYISKIHIQNYRNFNDFSMDFHKGLNVIIGANNSGKTGLLYAIKLLSNPKEISADDFNKNNLLQFKEKYIDCAPKIVIEYTIKHTISEDDTEDESIIRLLPFLGIKDLSDARREVDGKIEYTITAVIKAEYSLDVKFLAEYIAEVRELTEYDDYFSVLNRFVERYYDWNYTNGLSATKAESKDVTSIFDLRFIDAERTSEEVRRETKQEILRFMKDPAQVIKMEEFRRNTSQGLKEILSPTITKLSELFEHEENEIGLKKGNVAISSDVDTKVSASDAYTTKVRDTRSGVSLPLSHNGLGYNNLINIYMLIKLNEIKKGRDFRLLCLEEPEAHLHPAMQYKLFKYLRDLDKADKLNQQIFVTTHSSNISAVAGLDNMFMLSYNRSLDPIDCEQQSLFTLFESGPEERKVEKNEAKKHLAKFLDVTRSDLLFADKVIFVEGIAEKLLMPAFMEKCGVPYEDEHISIVEIGGKHFEHFIELFNGNAVKKKVLCITDKDFCWIRDKKLRSLSDYDEDVPNHIQKLSNRFSISELKVCTQKHYGRTFEDELFLENITTPDLVTVLFRKVSGDKIIEFIDKYGLTLSSWIAHQDEIDGRVAKSVLPFLTAYTNRADPAPTKEATYSQITLAELFLHYAEKQKGDFALEILTDDSLFDAQGKLKLTVPEYIREGLEWLKE